MDAGAITAIFSRRRCVSFDESAGQRHGTAMNDDILPDNPLGLQKIAKLSKTMNTLRVHRAKAVVEVAAGRHLSEIIDQTDDPIFHSPAKIESKLGSSLMPNELLTKRSPTSVCLFETQAAFSTFEATFPCENGHRSSFMPEISSLNICDGSNIWMDLDSADDISFALLEGSRSDTRDQTSSASFATVPLPPTSTAATQKSMRSSMDVRQHLPTLEICDFSPRKPCRTLSPKLMPMSSFGNTRRSSGIPHEITCVPPDAAPMKPARKDSGDVKGKSCPDFISIGNSFAFEFSVEKSKLSEYRSEVPFIAFDALPVKPSRKKSNRALECKGSFPTYAKDMISLEAALETTLLDEEALSKAVSPIRTFNRCLSHESPLPPTKPTRRFSMGKDVV